ncbi:Cytochrome P450 [Streptomyces sp. DvalAA-14]|uniref:cytochrome P450 n=1 Tax=unclassified Streptomyces TaxID=2593676 RepID=UPI00081B95FF|nr:MULTISPECIES: cytochrome P450 [unclassified Streptomyces]MYS24423.1 cytochrome P450 [Streptomyces sp. SID4948]SCE45877.1 Cytochrome P450 [Streptomyces sp. DvalAA-14]
MTDSIVEQLPPVLGGFDLTDHQLFAQADEGFPYDVFARLRKEAPVFYHPAALTDDGEGFWVLSRHEDIAHAANRPDLFSAQGGGGRKAGGSHLDDMPFGVLAGVIMPMLDNPRHHLMRHLLTPSVTGAAVAALEGDMRAFAASLVDKALAGGGAVDLASDVCEPYAFGNLAVLLGVPPADRAKIAEWAHDSVGFFERRSGLPSARSKETFLATTGYAHELLLLKQAQPEQDLGSALATGTIPTDAGEPPLTDHEREMNLLLLLLTGAEQPRNTIAGGLLALARHPEQWQALRADRSLVGSAVEEMLRWVPPNPYNRRTATRDVTVGRTLIRAGEKVTLWWPSANRDEEVFPRADRFDITRRENPHMTFGHGNHYCLGGEVARLEVRLLLEELLDRVAEIQVTGDITYQPSNKHTIVLDLPVRLVPADRTRL